MNTAHWHLTFNHLPITGTIFATLALCCGFILRNQTVKMVGLGLFIVTALLAIPALLTGEGAEDVLQSIGQKNEHFIHEHEELAEKAFWLSEIIGSLSILTMVWWRSKKRDASLLIAGILLAGLINSVMMMMAGNAGGEIRHSEIRSTNATTSE